MLNNFDLEKIKGLSSEEASGRIASEGYNEIPSAKKSGVIKILLEIVKEPMFLLLIACGSLYFFLGDIHEGLMLLGFVFVIIGITFYQQNKTERALEALKDLSSPRALVIRDGQQQRIAGRDVVREDIIVISEGDRVPADAVVISCNNLSVDESLLTGESVPVRKAEDKETDAIGKPGGDDLPYIFSGTMVVGGTGLAIVKATGINTELGKIGKSLQALEPEQTQLQKETKELVEKVAIIAIALCAVVIILYGLGRGHWTEGFLAGIALAMSMLPEEFPVILTIFLALGAWRMSKNNVLTRRQHAIQALGSATVLCVDKTGTLTTNKMTVRKLYANGKFFESYDHKALPEDFHEVVEFGILASQQEPFDPMEKALKELSSKTLKETEHIHERWELVQEYPLSKHLLVISHVWKAQEKEDYIIAAKGAPEAIFDLCHLSTEDIKNSTEAVAEMTNNGLRVIGVANAKMKKMPLPSKQHDFEFEFLGLVGFEDPVRETVPAAIKECYSAGIRVIMITGDYPGTAKKIAAQVGLSDPDEIITGSELEKMGDDELKEKIRKVNVFARVVPEQKLRIVNALKSNGEIVAMTGDGVNDAPALKSAHIGVAMGARGTDVAREASSVVLLDDDFSSIVHGVKTGRRIFDNIRKAMAYVLAVHMPIAGITVLAVVLGWPLILLPAHIVFLELIIDPACSVVFEAEKEEANIMRKPPRNPKERIFSRKIVMLCVLQGLAILAAIAALFQIALYANRTETDARALSFAALIIANIFLILANRSWSKNFISTLRTKNNAFWIISGVAALFLALVLYVPFLQELFRFGSLTANDIGLALFAGILCLLWFEVVKKLMNPDKIFS
jgi:Ca2+-transporting ATPase